MTAQKTRRQPRLGDSLLRGGGLTLLARLLAVGCGLFVQMLLARLISPAELGAYFLVQSLAVSMALVGQLGLPRIVVREIAKAVGAGRHSDVVRIVTRTVPAVFVGVGVVSASYAIVIGPWLGQKVFDSEYVRASSMLVSAWIAGMAFQNLSSESLRGMHRLGMAAFFGGPVSSLITAAVLTIALLVPGKSHLTEVLLVSVLSTFVTVVFSAGAVAKHLKVCPGAGQIQTKVLFRGAPTMLTVGLADNMISQSDLWIIGSTLGENELALYGAAKRLTQVVSLPMVIVSLVVPPLIADFYARGEVSRLQRGIRGIATLAGLPSLAILGLFISGNEIVLSWVFGPFYAAAGSALIFLSLERMGAVWAGPCSMTLLMTGNEKGMLTATFSGGCVQAIATAAGAYSGGLESAALGFFLGSLFRNILLWNEARRTTGIRTDFDPMGLREASKLLFEALRRTYPRG